MFAKGYTPCINRFDIFAIVQCYWSATIAVAKYHPSHWCYLSFKSTILRTDLHHLHHCTTCQRKRPQFRNHHACEWCAKHDRKGRDENMMSFRNPYFIESPDEIKSGRNVVERAAWTKRTSVHCKLNVKQHKILKLWLYTPRYTNRFLLVAMTAIALTASY